METLLLLLVLCRRLPLTLLSTEVVLLWHEADLCEYAQHMECFGIIELFCCICDRGKGGNRAGLVSRVSTHLVRFWTPAAFVLSHVPVTCRGTVSAVAGEAVTESILAGLTPSLLRLVAQILVN